LLPSFFSTSHERSGCSLEGRWRLPSSPSSRPPPPLQDFFRNFVFFNAFQRKWHFPRFITPLLRFFSSIPMSTPFLPFFWHPRPSPMTAFFSLSLRRGVSHSNLSNFPLCPGRLLFSSPQPPSFDARVLSGERLKQCPSFLNFFHEKALSFLSPWPPPSP